MKSQNQWRDLDESADESSSLDLDFMLNQTADRINTLNDRLSSPNVDMLVSDSRQKLEQWRLECYHLIDQFYLQKCEIFDRHVAKIVDKQRKDINRTRSHLAFLIHKSNLLDTDINQINSAVDRLEEEINITKDKYLQLDLETIDIHDSLIRIRDVTHKNVPTLLLPPVKTINYLDDSSKILSANDHQLLTHHNSRLCLFDRELNLVKEKYWSNGWIMDMCWSSTLARFLVLTKNYLYLIDENTMSIIKVQKLPKLNWWSCTCSDTHLFVSTKDWGSNIHQLSLWPLIQPVKLWQPPQTCEEDETINNMISNKEHIGMTIYHQLTRAKSIELRLSKTMQRIWSLDLYTDDNARTIRCCLIHHDEWLIVDWNTSHIFQVTNSGKLKVTSDYSPSPSSAAMFGMKMIAISTTDGINLHQF